MTVYHMGKDGAPKICKVVKGTCPLGGVHFNSLPEAKSYYELQLAKQFSANTPVEELFTVAQRRRMWQEHPRMSYVHPIGTIFISKRGDLWELVKREQIGGIFDHKFTLRNRRSGKELIVSTANELAPKERRPDDFAQLTPKSFHVDGPSKKDRYALLKSIPDGTQRYSNALISKIQVTTVENELDRDREKIYNMFGEHDKEQERQLYGRELMKPSYRYLIVDDFPKESLEKKANVNALARALWAHAGRSDEQFDELSSEERLNLVLNSKSVKNAKFYSKNGSTYYTNEDLSDKQFDSFWLPGAVPSSSVALYSGERA